MCHHAARVVCVAITVDELAVCQALQDVAQAPFDIAMPASYAYWIVCSKATAKLPKILAFSDWLLAEAAEDARQLNRLKSKSKTNARASA